MTRVLKWLAILSIVIIAGMLLLAVRKSFSGEVVASEDVVAEGISADVDFPVVLGVKGGMLEVAQITGRRSFPKSTDPVILGQAVTFCRERASWTAPYRITYRLRLGNRWTLRYRNGTLFAKVPELEPALPVAFDTIGLQKGAKESCWFAPDMGTRERALRSISPELAKIAKGKKTKDFAREVARRTVVEFLRTWTMKQTDYAAVASDAPIRVIFPGE